MKHVRTVAALIALLGAPACTDYATFVTATDIGINADLNTQTVGTIKQDVRLQVDDEASNRLIGAGGVPGTNDSIVIHSRT